MFSFHEQCCAVGKTHFEAQLAMLSTLTATTFEGLGKVFELNLSAAQASLVEAGGATRELLAAKDAQEFLSLSVAQAKPNADKAVAYGRHLAGIASDTQVQLSRAVEAQVAQTRGSMHTLLEEVRRNAEQMATSVQSTTSALSAAAQ